MEQQNKHRVIVSERATQMFVSHAAFLAQVSPEAAERLTIEFEKTANFLELMPQRCPWLTGEYIPRNAYRFIPFEKRYMIIFQIVDDIVDNGCHDTEYQVEDRLFIKKTMEKVLYFLQSVSSPL